MSIALPPDWRTNPKVAEATLGVLRAAKEKRVGRPMWDTPGGLAAALDPTTVQTPALDLLDQKLIWAYTTPGARLIVSMPPQEGKAIALGTPIATPSGWTTMGALRVGDRVFDRNGNPCTVTWVSPVWENRDCFAITTGDGERIVADAEHEWFARLDRRSSERIVTSRVLARTRTKNAQITAGASLNTPTVALPLDPYVLGAWLGDGHSKAAMFTSADIEITDRIRAAGVPCRRSRAKYMWSLAPAGSSKASPIRLALIALDVWGNKHIPVEYLRASREQRLALLQGLVDTDGHVSEKGQVEFTSTSLPLAEGVRELVYSLGAKAVLTESDATIGGRYISPKYRVRFYLADAAYLPRKAGRCKDSSVAATRYVAASPTESEPTVCIEVDSPDHSYLAGRTMLPTHNSQRATKTGTLWALSRDPERRIGIVSYASELATTFGREIRNWITTNNGLEGSLDLGLRIAPDNGAAARWSLAGHRGGVICVGVTGGLTGRPLDALIIDDPFADMEQAQSEAYRDKVWSWWDTVGKTRLSPGAPVILINTRWHEDDLAGRLIAKEPGRWDVVNILAQADHDPDKGETDVLGREPAEFLSSARGRTAQEWEQIKLGSGTRTWTSLYQGRPSPDAGNVLDRTWWRRYSIPPYTINPDGTRTVIEMDETLISVDATFKDTKSSDYVVMQVWARKGAQAYLLDQVRDRLSFTQTVAALTALWVKWPDAMVKLIEEKANGAAILDMLRTKVPGLIPVNPTESKYARTSAIAPFVEAGNALLPEYVLAADWVDKFIDEAAAFPNDAHDDQVDAMSQALARFFLDGTGAQAWIDFMRKQIQTRTTPEPPTVAPLSVEPVGEAQPPAPVEDPLTAARHAAFRNQHR